MSPMLISRARRGYAGERLVSQGDVFVSFMFMSGTRGLGDEEHLAFALQERRVIITSDDDFLVLHSQNVEHAGIAYFKQQTRTLKQVLRGLFIIHRELTQDDMMNWIEYL